MNIVSRIVLFTLILLGSVPGYGQSKVHNAASVRQIEFLVRNGDNIKDISAKIKVPVREILKANKLSSRTYVAYPGRRLWIPVHVQPKVWDPTKEDMTGNSPSREDRGAGEDYEPVIDSSNYKLLEDFINLSEARSDSFEYENIDKHIRKIDKRINHLTYMIDSLKQVDFKFDYEDQDKNSILGKMKMSRDKYYIEGPLGKQIDSLKEEKIRLGQRRIVLRNQITEYEFLVDNAGYSERNYKHEEKVKPSNWGDHLAYESIYLKGKNKPQPTQPDVAPVVKKDTVIPKPIAVKPAVETVKPQVTENYIDTADTEPILSHYKSDFALLPKQKFTKEIQNTSSQPALSQLSPSAIRTIPPPVAPLKETPKPVTPVTNTVVPVKKEAPKPVTPVTNTVAPVKEEALKPVTPVTNTVPVKETPKPVTPVSNTVSKPDQNISDETPKPRTDIIPKHVVKPVQEEPKQITPPAPDSSIAVKPQIAEDTLRQKHAAVHIDTLRPEFSPINSSDKPTMTLESKVDTTINRPTKMVNMDPLASYKSDSGFVAKSVQIKDIPIAEYKNKPKYLIPVDSVTRIKGEFYLIRARQVLEKGDFKTGDKYLRKSLDLNPNNAQSWMLHADLFLTMGLADQALKEYIISGEIDSTNPKIFYNIALLYTKASNNQKAYKYFSRAIETNAKYLQAYMGRASLLMDERDYEGAIQDYDRVLTANKYYSPAFKARGLAKMEVRKFTEAVSDFNQYLEIEDPDGFVIYQRGLSKIYSNNLLQGCLDLSSANELGFKEAEKAIKKFCE